MIFDTPEYEQAKDNAGKQDFTAKFFNTFDEALAVVEAMETQITKIGKSLVERRFLQLYKNSPQTFERFLRGEFIEQLGSGKYFLNFGAAEVEAAKENQKEKRLEPKEFEKLIKVIFALPIDQSKDLMLRLKKNAIYGRNIKQSII